MKYFSASAHRLVGTGLPLLAAVSNYVATKSFFKKTIKDTSQVLFCWSLPGIFFLVKYC